MAEPVYEIQVYDSWTKVSFYIFRSWGGPRRLNGRPYNGPVYFLGSRKIVA